MLEITGLIDEIKKITSRWRSEGLSVGLVPTMGFLHEGHKSLIERAVAENDRVVVSVFVNPAQFAPNEDLESYPRDINRDLLLCEDAGASIIFNPAVEEMYPEGFSTHIIMENLTKELCGKSRPTHFTGVCTVVGKLFNIVNPDRAYFGQKDAQQLAVIKRMARDLNFGVEIVACPIVREEDGLAKSSRNTYLSDRERKAALVLSRAVFLGKNAAENGERRSSEIIRIMTEEIETEPSVKIDYVNVVNAESIEPIETLSGGVLAAAAVYVGKTRLIDNFMIEI